MIKDDKIKKIITESGLRITFQRLLVLKYLANTDTHPTTEQIVEYVKKTHPNISTAAVYNILDTFVEKGIVKKVITGTAMRYDAITKKHHHIISEENNKVIDHFDEELNALIENYIKQKDFNGLEITDYNIQFITKKSI